MHRQPRPWEALDDLPACGVTKSQLRHYVRSPQWQARIQIIRYNASQRRTADMPHAGRSACTRRAGGASQRAQRGEVTHNNAHTEPSNLTDALFCNHGERLDSGHFLRYLIQFWQHHHSTAGETMAKYTNNASIAALATQLVLKK